MTVTFDEPGLPAPSVVEAVAWNVPVCVYVWAGAGPARGGVVAKGPCERADAGGRVIGLGGEADEIAILTVSALATPFAVELTLGAVRSRITLPHPTAEMLALSAVEPVNWSALPGMSGTAWSADRAQKKTGPSGCAGDSVSLQSKV